MRRSSKEKDSEDYRVNADETSYTSSLPTVGESPRSSSPLATVVQRIDFGDGSAEEAVLRSRRAAQRDLAVELSESKDSRFNPDLLTPQALHRAPQALHRARGQHALGSEHAARLRAEEELATARLRIAELEAQLAASEQERESVAACCVDAAARTQKERVKREVFEAEVRRLEAERAHLDTERAQVEAERAQVEAERAQLNAKLQAALTRAKEEVRSALTAALLQMAAEMQRSPTLLEWSCSRLEGKLGALQARLDQLSIRAKGARQGSTGPPPASAARGAPITAPSAVPSMALIAAPGTAPGTAPSLEGAFPLPPAHPPHGIDGVRAIPAAAQPTPRGQDDADDAASRARTVPGAPPLSPQGPGPLWSGQFVPGCPRPLARHTALSEAVPEDRPVDEDGSGSMFGQLMSGLSELMGAATPTPEGRIRQGARPGLAPRRAASWAYSSSTWQGR